MSTNLFAQNEFSAAAAATAKYNERNKKIETDKGRTEAESAIEKEKGKIKRKKQQMIDDRC